MKQIHKREQNKNHETLVEGVGGEGGAGGVDAISRILALEFQD